MRQITIAVFFGALLLAMPTTVEGAAGAKDGKTPKQVSADFTKTLKQSPKLKLADAQDAALEAAKKYFPSGCPEGVGSGCPRPAPTAHPYGTPGQDGSGVLYTSIQRLALYPCRKQKTALTWFANKYEGVKLRTKEFACSMTFRTYSRDEQNSQEGTLIRETCTVGSFQIRVVKAPVFLDTFKTVGTELLTSGGEDTKGDYDPLLLPLPGLHGKKWPKIEVGLLHDDQSFQPIQDPNPAVPEALTPC